MQWQRLGKPQIARLIAPVPPHFPQELSYLWNWYRQHEMGLAVSGMAPCVVTWESVAAWTRLMDLQIQPWEATAMIMLGYARFAANSEKIEAAAKSASQQRAG